MIRLQNLDCEFSSWLLVTLQQHHFALELGNSEHAGKMIFLSYMDFLLPGAYVFGFVCLFVCLFVWFFFFTYRRSVTIKLVELHCIIMRYLNVEYFELICIYRVLVIKQTKCKGDPA